MDIRHGTIDFIADIDLSSLFGNLLDNALEAALDIPEAYIEVNAVRRSKTPFIVITVINSSRKNPFEDAHGSLTTNKHDTLTFHTIITLKMPEETI